MFWPRSVLTEGNMVKASCNDASAFSTELFSEAARWNCARERE